MVPRHPVPAGRPGDTLDHGHQILPIVRDGTRLDEVVDLAGLLPVPALLHRLSRLLDHVPVPVIHAPTFLSMATPYPRCSQMATVSQNLSAEALFHGARATSCGVKLHTVRRRSSTVARREARARLMP
jgi:hypothetical protein